MTNDIERYLRQIANDLPKIEVAPATVSYRRVFGRCLTNKQKAILISLHSLKDDWKPEDKNIYVVPTTVEHLHPHFENIVKAWGKGGDEGNKAVIEYGVSARNMAANLNAIRTAANEVIAETALKVVK